MIQDWALFLSYAREKESFCWQEEILWGFIFKSLRLFMTQTFFSLIAQPCFQYYSTKTSSKLSIWQKAKNKNKSNLWLMGRNTIQSATRVCFKGFLFNIFLSHLLLKMSKIGLARYSDDNTPYTTAHDIDDVIRSFEKNFVKLF